MNVITFSDDTHYPKIAILIKNSAMQQESLYQYYIKPLVETGIEEKDIIAIGLEYTSSNKVPAALGKEHIKNILNACTGLKIDTLYVADANYFKFLTINKKTTGCLGTVYDCHVKNYDHIKVLLGVNYQALFYNDQVRFNLDESVKALNNFVHKNQLTIGTDIIHSAYYPESIQDISEALDKLHNYPALTCDIEAFSLRYEKAGIATIAFCYDMNNGIAFDVAHTRKEGTRTIYRKLKTFFETYKGKLTFHRGIYDVKVLIYTLFMNAPKDYSGMLHGLKVFKGFNDSLVLTFLATNSTAGNVLGLKQNSLEFAGNYAVEEINDVRRIPLKELLEYNLIDGLCTWYVVRKYEYILDDPDIRDFYLTIARPTLLPAIKMMIVGLPMDMKKVLKAERALQKVSGDAKSFLAQNSYIKQTEQKLSIKAAKKKNSELKKKIRPVSDFPVTFNTNSPDHLIILLHEVLDLEPIDTTPTKQPATGAKTLKKHLNRITDPDIIEVLNNLIEISRADIILNNFIKNFKDYAFYKAPGEPYLNGDLNTTGTQSGRFSSSNPNMQNMPSTSTYAKMIKACFVAPPGWMIGGADFSSLEDRINAILTQDPNKIKVYTDGYDGHCLRAHAYFGSEMPDIDPSSVKSINSIETVYPKLRQKSKTPTFALTYDGTWHTLVKNLGLSKEEAVSIENNYHKLYEVSDEWSKKNIKFAAEHGYVKCAFGLKLRTPLLKQTVINSKSTPYEAVKEGRSANNAITQSWGMLTNRAILEFEERLEKSPYQLDIFICNTIHDAIYLLFREDPKVIEWLNINLVECMQWNNHPAIQSKEVPMDAALDIGYSMDKMITLSHSLPAIKIQEMIDDKLQRS